MVRELTIDLFMSRLKLSIVQNYNRELASTSSNTITSRIGDGVSSDEWSKGRSSESKQVTSPTGNLDPYLPALPTKKTNDAS